MNENFDKVKNYDVFTMLHKLYIQSNKNSFTFFENLKDKIFMKYPENVNNSLKDKFLYSTLERISSNLNIFLWNIHKQAYNFVDNWVGNFTYENVLAMSGYEFKEHINTLAYNSFYITSNKNISNLFKMLKSSAKFVGFFVSIFNIENNTYIILSPRTSNNINYNSLIFVIDNRYSLNFNLTKTISLVRQNNENICEKDFVDSFVGVIQYILYLADANNIKHGEIIYKVSEEKEKQDIDIGYLKCFDESEKEGNIITIRDVLEPTISYTFYNKGMGIPKSTHTRRCHLHRYWVGHGDNKKLVERLVEATVINEGKTTLSKVMHNVK